MLSFFTRNLAPLAPDVLALLQHHEQAVDPNLKSLADAFQTVASKLDGQNVMQLLKQTENAAQAHADESKQTVELAEDVAEGLRALHAQMQLNTRRRKKKAVSGCAVGCYILRRLHTCCTLKMYTEWRQQGGPVRSAWLARVLRSKVWVRKMTYF